MNGKKVPAGKRQRLVNRSNKQDTVKHVTICLEAAKQIFGKTTSKLSYEEIYRACYNAVLHKHGPELYDQVSQLFEVNLNEKLEILNTVIESKFLEVIGIHWSEYIKSVHMIRDVLMYLDRQYVEKEKVAIDMIHPMALKKFCTIYFTENIKEKTVKIISVDIREVRNGNLNKNDNYAFRNVIDMFRNISGILGENMYEELFEKAFLHETGEFYQNESLLYLQENALPEYVHKVRERIEEEKLRADQYRLKEETTNSLIQVVKYQLVSRHMTEFLSFQDSGIFFMVDKAREEIKIIEEGKFEDNDYRRITKSLSDCYSILEGVEDGYSILIARLATYITSEGKKILDEASLSGKDPATKFVDSILDMRHTFDVLLKFAFNSNKTFKTDINDAFETVLNTSSSSSVLTAEYMHKRLLKSKDTDVEKLQLELDNSIQLLSLIYNKDIFEIYFKFHLSQRLLFDKCRDQDLEKEMIGKLKMVCGFALSTKLAGMFNDISVSEELREQFKADLPINLKVSVLTYSYWPAEFRTENYSIPDELVEATQVFEAFYANKFHSRVLTWLTSLGNGELLYYQTIKNKEEKRTLNLSTPMMSILLLFNNNEQLFVRDICAQTKQSLEDVFKNLVKLTKVQRGGLIQIRKKKGEKFSGTIPVTINPNFRPERKKTAIPPATFPSINYEEVQETAFKDRNEIIQLTLTRVMKAKKRLDIPTLIETVTNSLVHFKPEKQRIIRRLEYLIDKEYLDLDEKDENIVIYIS